MAEKIGLKECVPLEETGEWQELPCGIGVLGILEESEELPFETLKKFLD